MPIQCDNCDAQFEGRWELDEITDPHGNTRKVCIECDDPQSTFTEL
jgi:hypothetical protein